MSDKSATAPLASRSPDAAPGLMGATVDPSGPARDVIGSADLWFSANPTLVLPK
jgi:hypothetical protein